jgi:multidrug efflux pump subunit AcrB
MAGAGEPVGLLHDAHAREPVPIVLRLDRRSRGSLDAVRAVRLEGRAPVAVGELTRSTFDREARNVYHKNLQPVTYVTGDIAGAAESPVYSILQMNRALEALVLPEGYGFEIFNATQPFDTTRYAMKWDGEWHISY